MKNELCIHHHLGLGDHFDMNGMVRNYLKEYEKKPKMFSVVQEVLGKSVNDNDHPFTTQMNYLIEINDKYANDAKDPAPIFYNSEGDLKFADNSSNAALGTDSSGNSNTWTVNNLTAAASGATSFSSTNVTNVSNILDGNTSTGAVFTSTNAVFDAVCNISGITQLEFLIYDGSGDNKGQMQYRVNGGSYVNASYNNTNNYVWNNATSLLTNGTLTSFGFKLIGSPNGGAKAARYTTSAGTFYITSTPTDEIDCVLDSPTLVPSS